MDEFMKSLKAYLYDKTSSPLYSTFIISWCIWNWKIFYVTLFMNTDIHPDKMQYIEGSLISWWNCFWLPLISTTVLIGIIPLFANGSKWVTAKYEIWMRKQMDALESKVMITLDESFELRKGIEQERAKFVQTISEKNNEIALAQTTSKTLANRLAELDTERKGLKFLKATFGADHRVMDVTEILNGLIKDDSIELAPSISLFGDPFPGREKQLVASYVQDGKFDLAIVKEGGPKHAILSTEVQKGISEMLENQERIKNLKAT